MTNESSNNSDLDAPLLAQVRESFGRVVYSHKTHEKQADICFKRHRIQLGTLIALTALSSGTFLVALLGVVASPVEANLVTSFVAILLSAASLSAQKLKYADEAEAHRDAASSLWNVRESYISLISDLMAGTITNSDAHARRDRLQKATLEAYTGAPRTTNKAYKLASKGLKKNEEMTFTSREIDLFLPEALQFNTYDESKGDTKR